MNHDLHKCDDENRNGGLSWCKICGGVEGSLPTNCPGRKMIAQETNSIYNKWPDYKNSKWVDLRK